MIIPWGILSLSQKNDLWSRFFHTSGINRERNYQGFLSKAKYNFGSGDQARGN